MDTVVVLGGGEGIGQAAARLFAEGGARVIVTCGDPARVDDTARRLGGTAIVRAVEPGDARAVSGLFSEVGPFQHLVLAIDDERGAGPFRGLDLWTLRAAFEVKVWAQIAAAQAALATLDLGGSITFVTPAHGRVPRVGAAGLAALGGALHEMVPSLALELAPVRVNAVAAGVLDTPWWNRVPPATRDALMQRAAAAPANARDASTRNLRALDVARAVVFCATSGFVTGAVLECDGGARFVQG